MLVAWGAGGEASVVAGGGGSPEKRVYAFTGTAKARVWTGR
jgi:hypothetical protein